MWECVCMRACNKCHVHHFPSGGELTSCFALHRSSAFLPAALLLMKWLSCFIWAVRTPSSNHLIKGTSFIWRNEVKCCFNCNVSDHPHIWLQNSPSDYRGDPALHDGDNILLILNGRRWSTQSVSVHLVTSIYSRVLRVMSAVRAAAHEQQSAVKYVVVFSQKSV